jgi:hypothetical protein
MSAFSVGDDLLLLLAGFGLTTVAGGFLAYVLQNRTWRRQERDRLRQAQLEAARVFYEELSRLLDRRRHAMLQLDRWLETPNARDDIERLLDRYRTVLDEWNSNLNRNLALSQRYFGEPTRADLHDLYKRFAEAGTAIERRVREYKRDGEASSPPQSDALGMLDVVIYDLNIEMLDLLMRGAVGIETTARHGQRLHFARSAARPAAFEDAPDAREDGDVTPKASANT